MFAYHSRHHAVMTQHHMMLERNLLSTGITRGKMLAVLVGQKKAGVRGGGMSGRVTAG